MRKSSPHICMLMLVYFAFVLLQLYDKLQCTIYIKIPLLVECTWQSPTLCMCFCIVMCVMCCNVKSILWGKVQRQFKGDSPTCWHPHPHLLHSEGRAHFTSLHFQIVLNCDCCTLCVCVYFVALSNRNFVVIVTIWFCRAGWHARSCSYVHVGGDFLVRRNKMSECE